MATSKASKYLGDAAVAKCLERYGSHTPFDLAFMRFMGAQASPNPDLVPVMVIASFWPDDKFPQFQTQEEANLFFSHFMGLWRRVEQRVADDKSLLRAKLNYKDADAFRLSLQARIDELEFGFIEGFWGGADDLPMASATAALIDGIGDHVQAYAGVLAESQAWQDLPEALVPALRQELIERDHVVEDAIKALFLIKHKAQGEA